MTLTSTVQVADGKVWTIRLSGDVLQIIDDEGRERHRSKTHTLTGCYLALVLSERPFESCPELDAALRRSAEFDCSEAEASELMERHLAEG